MIKDKALTMIKSYARNHVAFRKFAKSARDKAMGMRYMRGNRKERDGWSPDLFQYVLRLFLCRFSESDV